MIKSLFFTAITVLVFSPTLAQEQIKDLFQEISQYAGVTQIGEQKTSNTDTTGITSESSISIIRVKKAYYPAVFDKLEKAFHNENSHASMIYTHIGDDNTNGISVSPRQQWSVWRDGASPILVGSIKNSSYLMANFDDQEHPGYRTCYAAEWSDADDPDVRIAKLIYVYGHKPEMQVKSQLFNYQGSATWPGNVKIISGLSSNLQINDGLKERLQELRKLPDSLFTMKIERLAPLEDNWQDIPVNGDLAEWTNKAMNNVKHLSNSDWHRYFGLLTQKMMDQANKESSEGLVVAAGIILDLCKNAGQLDADEREVSARRLEQVASTLKSNQYVHDLLMLGAKKLKTKKK